MPSGDLHYALGKLRQFVGELATGSGDARARVYDVMRGLWALSPEDFPPALRSSFRSITDDIERRRKPDGGYRYTNRTAARTARAIYNLYRDLESYLEHASRRHDSAMRIYEGLVSEQCRELLEQLSPDVTVPAESVYFRFEPWHEDTPTARYDPEVPCVIIYRQGAQADSDYEIVPTVRQAADPLAELLLVAHELGHHHSKLSFSFSAFEPAKPRSTYAEEVRAWEIGRRLLARYDFLDWDAFETAESDALLGYRRGLRVSKQRAAEVEASVLTELGAYLRPHD